MSDVRKFRWTGEPSLPTSDIDPSSGFDLYSNGDVKFIKDGKVYAVEGLAALFLPDAEMIERWAKTESDPLNEVFA